MAMVRRAVSVFIVIVWFAGLCLRASSTEPFPGSNGVPNGASCEIGGCHVSSAPDYNRGSVAIEGLPSQWLPNTTYNLTVVVQRPAAARFGFQLSSLFAGTGRQAGTLSAGESVVTVFTYYADNLQYAQHNNAPFASGQRRFLVNWKSPATTVGGDVTFYVAGNAANGNLDRTGDAIYLANFRVPPSLTLLTSRSFSLPTLGSSSLKSSGEGSSTQTGYARITADSGSSMPAGVAIFSFRANNVLVSEAGVPASALLTSVRIHAEVSSDGVVNTGLAIANPNAQATTIRFGSSTYSIPANGQVAKFLDQAPFNVSRGFTGAFTFTSDLPVAVIALRGVTNERGEFLMTTMPVVDLNGVAPASTQVIPHFADGGGWTTQIVLVNPGNSDLGGTVQFMNSEGQPISSSAYSVPAAGSRKITTSGLGDAVASGSVRVIPSGGGAVPVAFAVFTFRKSGITVSEAGVPVVRGNAFRMPAESAVGIQTGLALANAGTTDTVVTLDLYKSDGTSAGLSTTVPIGLGKQVAKFLNEFFPSMPAAFQGVLRIRSGSSDISVVGLRGRTNERNDFLITTTPASIETTVPGPELFFPHIADGGGYTTQFVLHGAGSGSLRFFKQDGTGWSLTISP